MTGFRVWQLENSYLWAIGGVDYYSPKLNAAARSVPGTHWDSKLKAQIGYIDAIEQVVARMRAYKLRTEDTPENKRQWKHNLLVSYEGAREYQKEGIDFLINQARSGALLADDMGCIDGDAIVQVSRAGISRKMQLSELHRKFNGGKSRGRAWRKDVPTKVRALVGYSINKHGMEYGLLDDGELRMQTIRKVIDKGVQPVWKLTLKSGKTLRMTDEHEVAAPGEFKKIERFYPGMKVLTNGRPKCKRCGSTKNVCVTAGKKFIGYCRTCIYRYLRKKPTFKGGKSLDKSGYVRVSGMHNHPRANRHGQVLEHHLVMERFLGRHLRSDEVVHHVNEVKADNRLKNLELSTVSEHARTHGRKGGYRRLNGSRGGKGGLVQFIPVEDEVVSVGRDGEAHVYDIVCEDPYRNFVANGIVVHNCGKSLQAVKAARALRRRTVIVCPAHVRGVWERPADARLGEKGGELAKWWPDATVFAPYGTKAKPIPEDANVFVTHYDIVHAWVEEILEWGANLSDDGVNLTAIFDEAHILLNPTTRRSKACREIAEHARGRIGLTGTPPVERVKDLYNVVETISPGRFGDFFPYGIRYCAGQKIDVPIPGGTTKTVWSFEGKSNLKELRQRLDWFCLRRTKREVLKELPAMQRQVVDIDVPPKNRIAMNARLVGDKRRMRMALDSAADGKFKSVLEIVQAHLEAGQRVVVGTYRRAVCEKFADLLGEFAPTRFIHGGVPLPRRGKITDELKRIEGPCCLVANIDCTSTGIDLTFASVGVIAELVWEPRELSQWEARLHRYGQEERVLIQYIIARGTGDELILHAVINKLDNHLELVETDKGDGMKETLKGEDDGLARLAKALKKMGRNAA